MSGWKSALRARASDFAPARAAYRLRVLWADRRLVRKNPRRAWTYLRHSQELTNFTYELANEPEIVDFVAGVLDCERDRVAGYLDELRADEELLAELRPLLADAPGADHEPKLGKRRAVYCALRVEQPAIVAETGVHNGLGSAVVLRALERNEAEGRPGKLLAFDIEPETGWLVDRDRHSERFHFYLGDTKSTLPAVLAEHGVDFFIHDSVHQYEFEVFEFETALQHSRGERLVLYHDDAGITPALGEICSRNDGRSRTLQEVPRDHYWRGQRAGSLPH